MFTDEDLKWLCSLLANCEFEAKHPRMDIDWNAWILRIKDDVLPLARKALFRLEAAERFIELEGHPATCVIMRVDGPLSPCDCGYRAAEEAWRKACGK